MCIPIHYLAEFAEGAHAETGLVRRGAAHGRYLFSVLARSKSRQDVSPVRYLAAARRLAQLRLLEHAHDPVLDGDPRDGK